MWQGIYPFTLVCINILFKLAGGDDDTGSPLLLSRFQILQLEYQQPNAIAIIINWVFQNRVSKTLERNPRRSIQKEEHFYAIFCNLCYVKTLHPNYCLF